MLKSKGGNRKVLKMAQKQYIKHLYENGEKSLREISRIMDLSFQTVKKYAYEENWNQAHLPNVEPSNHPLLGPYIETIDKWLEEDRRAPRKQRHTASRIHARLQEECGYPGKYSGVKKYVRKKQYLMRQQEAGFLPLAQPMGNAQVDFGKMVYHDSLGREKDGYALTISFPYSNHALTQVFPSQNQECLLEGMKRIFERIGGVPVKLKADNMTTAVAQVLEGKERILSDGFARFMLHYRFQAEFCNPASGNEKGNVENKVGYSRRNFFVPVPVIEDFDAYNLELFERCEKDAEREHYKKHVLICELWEEEKQKLLYLPEYEYEVYRYETARLNKYGCAVIETNSYGLSPELAGQTVQAKIYFDRVELFYDHTLLKVYPRCYERDTEVLDWTQYVGTLCKKPHAVEHTRFFHQLPKLWQEHLLATGGKERKSALMLLSEIVRDGNAALCDDTLALAVECGRTDTDSLRQCYYMIAKREYRPQPLTLTAAAPALNYNPNLTAYDGLTGGARNV
jgi:transposase